jgi:hypothetical protein
MRWMIKICGLRAYWPYMKEPMVAVVGSVLSMNKLELGGVSSAVLAKTTPSLRIIMVGEPLWPM